MLQSVATPTPNPTTTVDSIQYPYWLISKIVVCIGLFLVLSVVRSWRKGALVDNKDFIDITLVVTGVFLPYFLLFRSFDLKVLSLLQEDIITLIIGAFAASLGSINEEAKQDFLHLLKAVRDRLSRP